jgi:DNA-binding CsgD family transcriptional regulator
VKTTLKRVYRKLGAVDKTSAVVLHQGVHGFCARPKDALAR